MLLLGKSLTDLSLQTVTTQLKDVVTFDHKISWPWANRYFVLMRCGITKKLLNIFTLSFCVFPTFVVSRICEFGGFRECDGGKVGRYR